MRYHHTTSNCLKPQSLFRSALSPSRASSPAARFQWTDVDTPERYPAIHFKNGHVTCYVMLGHIRLYYNHEAMSNAVKRCQMLQTQSSWRLEKSFVFRCFQINWSTPLKTLTQSCVQGRPGIARVTLKKKTQILKWKLFPVDQWIDWGGKILTGNNGLHMILPWNIGVSCRFSHPTEVNEPVDRKHLGKWWGSLLDMQKQHGFPKSFGPGNATSRTINNHNHAEIMPENAGTTSVWLKRL